jgi:peroxiredoxin
MIKLATRLALAVSVALATVACGSAGGGGSETAAGAQHPLVGSPAPDFTVDRIDGKGKIQMSSLKGKVVVVDFWATWCEPCKKSFPKLQGLYVKYNASGVEIVGISQDDETGPELSKFGESFGAKFPLGWDNDKVVAKKYDLKSMPSSFVIDKNGIVRFAHLGYHDGDEDEIEKEVKSLL